MMMNFRATLLPVLATWGCVLVAAGCGSPTKPSSEQSMVIRGMVSDRTGSPLAGALVEILTGSRAGTKIRTDRSGKFELLAETAPALQARMAEEQVILRVSHNGFQARTVEDGWSSDVSYPPGYPLTGHSLRVIWLDNGPTIDFEPGAYTLTTTIDLATARDFLPRAPCKGFPAELASRSFPATIELRDRALELYQVTVETRPSTTIFPLYRVRALPRGRCGAVDHRGDAWLPLSEHRRGDVRDDRAAQRHWNVGLRPVLRLFSVLSVEVSTGDRPRVPAHAARECGRLQLVHVGERDDDLHEALTVSASSLRVEIRGTIS